MSQVSVCWSTITFCSLSLIQTSKVTFRQQLNKFSINFQCNLFISKNLFKMVGLPLERKLREIGWKGNIVKCWYCRFVWWVIIHHTFLKKASPTFVESSSCMLEMQWAAWRKCAAVFLQNSIKSRKHEGHCHQQEEKMFCWMLTHLSRPDMGKINHLDADRSLQLLQLRAEAWKQNRIQNMFKSRPPRATLFLFPFNLKFKTGSTLIAFLCILGTAKIWISSLSSSSS